MRDAAGNTALHKAAECNQPTACRFLIANGADPLIKNCEGRVPADLATASVAKVIMEEPLKPNADIESQLLEAAKNGDLDTVKVRGERERGEIATSYRMVGNFRGKSEKALKINFRGFKFRDSNQSKGVVLLHKR